jgi:hypothetical protein
MLRFLLASFQLLVFRASIKASPFLHLEAAGSTNENTHPNAFVSYPLHLLVGFG